MARGPIVSWALPVVIVAAVSGVDVQPAHAGSIVSTALVTPVGPGGLFSIFGPRTMGYTFTLTLPRLATELGILDDLGDGLGEAHPVGLWTAGGTLLASATVPAGTLATLDNGFRYVPIVPVALAAGTYTLGAFYPSGTLDAFFVSMPVVMASGTTFGGAVTSLTSTFAMPTFATGASTNPGFFGPNLRFIPGPAGTALAGFGALSLARRRRRS